ncbi:MAG: hypothetical protein HOV79_11960 [Hamadaea sp.]|nr:hypothetical protein [Hamadaea sp.]
MTTSLRIAWRGSRQLLVLAGVMAGLALVSLVGLIVDDRTVLGQPVWLKPFKFGVSFVVYGFTLAWLLGQLHLTGLRKKVKNVSVTVLAVSSFLEVAVIVLQAARARPSHFNSATDFDDLVWTSMGVMAGFILLGSIGVALMLWRGGTPDPAVTTAVRFGLLLLVAGMVQAFTMVVPRPEQIALDTDMQGAHAVAVDDGGPGMPLTGWSTTGGDLRVGHFVGIHGLQATILFALALSWWVRDAARRVRLTRVFAGAYAGVLVLVTWQALRGQPLVAPDATTLAAAAALVAATALAGALAWRLPRPSGQITVTERIMVQDLHDNPDLVEKA